jgi:hypothetical protein
METSSRSCIESPWKLGLLLEANVLTLTSSGSLDAAICAHPAGAEGSEPVDALDDFWRRFNEGRLEAATALCSSDFEYIDFRTIPTLSMPRAFGQRCSKSWMLHRLAG